MFDLDIQNDVVWVAGRVEAVRKSWSCPLCELITYDFYDLQSTIKSASEHLFEKHNVRMDLITV